MFQFSRFSAPPCISCWNMGWNTGTALEYDEAKPQKADLHIGHRATEISSPECNKFSFMRDFVQNIILYVRRYRNVSDWC
jgi:hypothetical protein